jgi:hypothetical protein
MKLYHGSLDTVSKPEIREPSRTLDYGKGFTHDYDVVYGPVANDRVYAAFALYEGGILDKQALIAELKTYKLVDQYLFHTEQSLKLLSFIEAKEVEL